MISFSHGRLLREQPVGVIFFLDSMDPYAFLEIFPLGLSNTDMERAVDSVDGGRLLVVLRGGYLERNGFVRTTYHRLN